MDYSFQGLIRIGISEHYPYIHVILLTAPLLAASLRPERQLSMLSGRVTSCIPHDFVYNARHIRFKPERSLCVQQVVALIRCVPSP